MASQPNQHRDPYPDIRPSVSLRIPSSQVDFNPLSDTLAQSDESELCVVFCAEQPNVHLRATSLLYPHAIPGGYFHVAEQQFGRTQDWIIYSQREMDTN